MPQTVLYFIKPRGSFHFGERGVGIEETADLLHSDTLFSAIVVAWRQRGRDLAERVAPFLSAATEPPFRLSSAFPYARDVLFFPAPQAKLGQAKGMKKVKYVSPGVLEQLQRPRALEQQPKPGDIDPKPELIQGSQVWVTSQERDRIGTDRLWSRAEESIAPHVAIDRVSSASNFYYSGQIRHAPECGLYFWAQFADDAYREHLEEALRFLENEGLGGRRSGGNGQFTLDSREGALPEVASANYRLMLSLYHPSPAELRAGILDDASYALIQRRGWVDSSEGRNWRRKGVWMVREGSLFKRAPAGQVIDLKPDPDKIQPTQKPLTHPVWRSGLALTMPILLREEGE